MSFGIANNFMSTVRECTPEQFAKVLDSPAVARTCAEIVDALEAHRRGETEKEEFEKVKGNLKKQLPIATFHAMFANGRRKNSEAVPSGLSIYDIDHLPNPVQRWTQIEARKEELGILLAHITPSTEGLRLVFVVPQGMTLAQAQAWMAQQLADKQYDVCVKDYARSSFLVPREYVLYLDEAGLFGPVQQPVRTTGGETPPAAASPTEAGEVPAAVYPTTYDGLPYPLIVSVLEEQMGGAPEHGNRNNFIFSMACHLRHVCNDEAEWIAQLLPTYGEAREKWMATIRSACARSQSKMMPNLMQRTLTLCRQRLAEKYRSQSMDDERRFPPVMPEKLPPLIELLVSRTPAIYRPAVAHAVFPALAAHLWKTTFRYIDNVEHEATLMNVLMAGTGAGKNCISEPINRILADIRRRDKENMLREKAWKKEMMTAGANKTKRQRPEGLVIQEIDPDMTNAAFVQRLADAEGKFLYTKMNEIDQFDALKSSSNRKSQFQIMCLAFDPGNVYGQTRIGTGSVTERVCIRFNWNASTTVRKGQAYFRQVLTDGPISRINFCTIPEREIGSPLPVYGSYDDAFDRELAPYIDRLNGARGEVVCAEATELARKLMEENAEFARLSQSRVYENLSFRANVIAYLKAMVLYVAHNGQWSNEIADFVRWSLQYDMWCKMEFFGEAIDEVDDTEPDNSRKPGPRNLLDLLPDVFTFEETTLMRQRMNINKGSTQTMLNNWKNRGYIVCYGEPVEKDHIERQQYSKTKAYKKKYA